MRCIYRSFSMTENESQEQTKERGGGSWYFFGEPSYSSWMWLIWSNEQVRDKEPSINKSKLRQACFLKY